MQDRQTRTPSSGLSMRTMRPQRPHDGRTTPATPAPSSISMNRGTARSGERCASPVRSAGFTSSAHASFCWYEGRGAERRTASATVSLPAPGSRAATMPQMTATGSRPSRSGHFPHRGRPARSRLETRRRPAACRARFPDLAADAAVPVVAAALESAQQLAASSACRPRDLCRPCLDQHDQQVCHCPGRGRPAIGQDLGPPGQRQGESCAAWPALRRPRSPLPGSRRGPGPARRPRSA